jgi:hypothetical protein
VDILGCALEPMEGEVDFETAHQEMPEIELSIRSALDEFLAINLPEEK